MFCDTSRTENQPKDYIPLSENFLSLNGLGVSSSELVSKFTTANLGSTNAWILFIASKGRLGFPFKIMMLRHKN